MEAELFPQNELTAAAEFAKEAHGDQKYGEAPYWVHLEEVYQIVKMMAPKDIDLQRAAFLHDVLEDCPRVSEHDLRNNFGERVTILVKAVTKERGKTRAQTNAVTYLNIYKAGSDAILLKLADRLANVRNCWQTQSTLLYMYYREYAEFRRALRDESAIREAPLWTELDRLSGWYERGK